MSDNHTRFFRSLFLEAQRKSEMYQFVEADEICFRLLREPQLPLLYRAGCNLLLAFGDANPVGFAKEAVYWYKEMYDEVKDDPIDGPKHKLLLEQAQDALDNAERGAAEKDEQGDEEEDEVEREETMEVETAEQGEVTEDVEMLSESDSEKAGESNEPSRSLPAIVSDVIMDSTSTLPILSSQTTQVDDTATAQEEKKGSSDEE